MQNIDPSHRRKNTVLICLRLIIIVLYVLLLVINFNFIHADTAHPDTAPTITHLFVNRNLISNSDILIYGLSDIPYDTPPSITGDQCFSFKLKDAGNNTLSTIVPFAYAAVGNGYNKGLFGFYFSSSPLTWGNTYTIQIAENPAQFTSPQNWDFTLSTANYTTLITQQDNQGELTNNMITIGSILQAYYNQSIMTTSGSRIVLSQSVGETYFRGAISGIRDMAPSLFLVQNLDIDLSPTQWTTEQFDTYQNRWEGTWVGEDMEVTAEQVGMSSNMVMSFIFTLPLCLAFIIFSAIKFRRTEPGFLAVGLFLIMTVLMDWLPRAVFATIYQACGIYIAWLLFYSRG